MQGPCGESEKNDYKAKKRPLWPVQRERRRVSYRLQRVVGRGAGLLLQDGWETTAYFVFVVVVGESGEVGEVVWCLSLSSINRLEERCRQTTWVREISNEDWGIGTTAENWTDSRDKEVKPVELSDRLDSGSEREIKHNSWVSGLHNRVVIFLDGEGIGHSWDPGGSLKYSFGTQRCFGKYLAGSNLQMGDNWDIGVGKINW